MCIWSEFVERTQLQRPCWTTTRDTLRWGRVAQIGSATTTPALGRHWTSPLCWTSTVTTGGRNWWSSNMTRWRWTFTKNCVSGQTTTGDTSLWSKWWLADTELPLDSLFSWRPGLYGLREPRADLDSQDLMLCDDYFILRAYVSWNPHQCIQFPSIFGCPPCGFSLDCQIFQFLPIQPFTHQGHLQKYLIYIYIQGKGIKCIQEGPHLHHLNFDLFLRVFSKLKSNNIITWFVNRGSLCPLHVDSQKLVSVPLVVCLHHSMSYMHGSTGHDHDLYSARVQNNMYIYIVIVRSTFGRYRLKCSLHPLQHHPAPSTLLH